LMLFFKVRLTLKVSHGHQFLRVLKTLWGRCWHRTQRKELLLPKFFVSFLTVH
jgi:hypothetical protein